MLFGSTDFLEDAVEHQWNVCDNTISESKKFLQLLGHLPEL